MGFNINDMIATAGNYARNYLFYAKVTADPVGLAVDYRLPYLVSSTTLPVSTIEPLVSAWQGMEYKFGGVQTFDTFEIIFKCDEFQDLRRRFVMWMNMVHDPETNIHGNPSDTGGYMGSVSLTQINTQGNPIMTYMLHKAWPSTVGEVTLDYTSKEISTFTVTFTYTYHTSGLDLMPVILP